MPDAISRQPANQLSEKLPYQYTVHCRYSFRRAPKHKQNQYRIAGMIHRLQKKNSTLLQSTHAHYSSKVEFWFSQLCFTPRHQLFTMPCEVLWLKGLFLWEEALPKHHSIPTQIQGPTEKTLDLRREEKIHSRSPTTSRIGFRVKRWITKKDEGLLPVADMDVLPSFLFFPPKHPFFLFTKLNSVSPTNDTQLSRIISLKAIMYAVTVSAKIEEKRAIIVQVSAIAHREWKNHTSSALRDNNRKRKNKRLLTT